VKIFGIPIEVRAEIECLDALSGHADSGELINWMKPLIGAPRTLKRVFLVHGEPQESSPLAKLILSTFGIEAIPVCPGQIYDLAL
jgi:metallo-beta-lactamase family protein